MSYNFIVVEKQPNIYVPMNVFDNNLPVDLLGNALQVFSSNGLQRIGGERLGKFALLEDSQYIKSESGSTSSTVSVGMWFKKNSSGEPENIFFCGSNSAGFGASITESSALRIYRSGSTSHLTSVEISEGIHFILFSSDSSTLFVYLDGEQIYSTQSYSTPAASDFYVGSLWNENAEGSLYFSQVFQMESFIDESEAKILYDLGSLGYQKFTIDSSSSVDVSDGNQNFLQTSWQAYGIVTVKG